MAHRMPIQIRFYDTDALGHVNNAAYAHYVELGRLHFLRELDVAVERLILARLELDFRAQVRFGEEAEVSTEVAKLGTSSMHMYQEVLVDGRVAAEARSVVVHFDYASGRSTPIPDDLRERLMQHARA